VGVALRQPVLVGDAPRTALVVGMDEDLQRVGRVGKDVKPAATHDDARLLGRDAAEHLRLRLKELSRCLSLS